MNIQATYRVMDRPSIKDCSIRDMDTVIRIHNKYDSVHTKTGLCLVASRQAVREKQIKAEGSIS